MLLHYAFGIRREPFLDVRGCSLRPLFLTFCSLCVVIFRSVSSTLLHKLLHVATENHCSTKFPLRRLVMTNDSQLLHVATYVATSMIQNEKSRHTANKTSGREGEENSHEHLETVHAVSRMRNGEAFSLCVSGTIRGFRVTSRSLFECPWQCP